jgi:two-component system cell cycle sensor histidine kinase/response regulator CckA
MRSTDNRIKVFFNNIITGGLGSYDNENMRKVKMVNVMSLIALVILIPFGIVDLVRGSMIGIFVLVVAAVLLFNLYYLRKSGEYLFPAYCGISIVAIYFFYALATGGVNNTGYLWCFTFPLFALFLLGTHAGMVATLLLLGAAIVFFVASPSSSLFTTYSVDFAIRFVLSYLVVVLFSYLFEHLRGRAEEKLSLTNVELTNTIAELKDSEEELRESHEVLEQRVKERTAELLKANEQLEREIGERRAVEQALRESEERYRNLFEQSRDAIFITSREGRLIDSNQSVVDLFGYSRKELRSLNVIQLYVNLDDRSKFQKVIEKRGSVRNFEVKLRKKDGTEMECLITATVSKIDDGSILGYQGIIRDITEKKRSEDKLRESEEKYRTLVERANDGIVFIQDGILKYVNPRLAEIGGYTVDELINTPFANYIYPDDLPRVLDYYERRMAGKRVPSTYEAAIRHRNGTRIEVEFNASVIPYEDKPAAFTIVRDMTDRKRLEAQLQQAQRMEAIGTLAGGIAHNFNNLLTGIIGNTSLILLDTDSAHPSYERLKNIERLVDSGAKLTGQLLGYARKGQYEVKPLDLNWVVQETSDTFSMTKKELTIHRDLAGDLYGVKADQGQIEQILWNLYVNAAEAMHAGGTLFIKTANATDKDIGDKPYKVKRGNYILLEVRDTGAGMDKKTMERIFEPFFTTKGLAAGIGLGLASVYGTVKAHGGYIDVDSKKGKGTTFRIYLPALKAKVPEKEVTPVTIERGHETILLVDDESMILEIGQEMLKILGYTVLQAKGGQEAIEIYRAQGDTIELVILDMIMPDLGGSETYDKLKELNPRAKVLLSSGYDIDGQASEILERGCDGFIQKPFDMTEFSQRIRKVLDTKKS